MSIKGTLVAETILVVEDDDIALGILRDALEGAGYRVATATDGESALAVMEARTPDLVVSDITMPGMDGYSFHEAVRARAEWHGIPFIFLSGRADRLDIQKGKRQGADDYLVKPFALDDLVVAVRSRLDRRAQLEALRARDVSAVKTAILATLNHEIRTPITALAGYAELLRDSASELDPERLKHMTDPILAGSGRLVRLVEDLVLLVDLRSGEAQKRYERRRGRIDHLAEQIRSLVERERDRAAVKRVELRLEVPEALPPVVGEPELLGNAVDRLLDNAIKFSKPGGGAVTVSARPGPGEVVIEIRDEGIGVRREDLDNIMDLFYQSDRARMEQQGMGFGLTTSRSIVTIHGGTLKIDSEIGVGTTVSICLPAAAEEAPSA